MAADKGASCATCGGYGFVEVPGEHAKTACPDCAPKRTFASERVERIRSNTRLTRNLAVPSNRAPVEFTRCPVHGQKIGRDGEGRLLGRCAGCASDYAKALRWMRSHPYARAAA